MRRLSPRRFPSSIVRRRQEEGGFNGFGEWEPGMVSETTFSASVQPLGDVDAELVGGSQLSARRVVYIAEPDALRAAFEDREADVVVVDTVAYIVTDSWSWERHTKAKLLRET